MCLSGPLLSTRWMGIIAFRYSDDCCYGDDASIASETADQSAQAMSCTSHGLYACTRHTCTSIRMHSKGIHCKGGEVGGDTGLLK